MLQGQDTVANLFEGFVVMVTDELRGGMGGMQAALEALVARYAVDTAPPAPPEGVIAIEAPDFTRASHGKGLQWTAIDHLGRTRGAVVALPQGLAATTPADNVRMDYVVDVERGGPATLTLYLAPTLDTSGASGVRIGVCLKQHACHQY